jgi:hypothetical protein
MQWMGDEDASSKFYFQHLKRTKIIVCLVLHDPSGIIIMYEMEFL